MDILSHGLWTGAIYKIIGIKIKRRFRLWLAVFWGIFPDFIAFTPLFIWLFWNIIFSGMSFADFPNPDAVEPVSQNSLFIHNLTSILYSMSHSIFVFIAVFGLLLIFKRGVWEMGGWLIHILIDIPTHSYKFYPTPFLWPVSGWKFSGLSWASLYFMIVNYALIILVYIFLYRYRKLGKV